MTLPRVILLLLLLPLAALADERILDYHSDILVHADGWLTVTETIRVRAEGNAIRRGIYRDYPTRYRDRLGNQVQVRYEPLSVLRDDRVEDFHTESKNNGVRTYFGSAQRVLDPGEYTYEYRYRAGRMIGFFAGHDELYWNVTGNGWQFPIDRASATVRFEFSLDGGDLEVDAFTGGFGAVGKAFDARVDGPRAIVTTTSALPPGAGLTLVVSWPKGLVAEPGRMQRALWLLGDNLNLLVACAGLLLMFAYYVPVWHYFGRDPRPGVTMTRYEPPADLSPASLRYIRAMGYDNKVMTAAVVNLAVKGRLRIEQSGDTQVLVRTVPDTEAPALANGERELLEALFEDGNRLVLEDDNHARVSGARQAHKRSLQRDYRNRFFKVNGLMNFPAFLLMIGAAIVALTLGGGPTIAVLIVIGLMIVTAAVFAYLMKRPTGIGRRVLDEMAGFREYLEIAEKDELNLRNPPQKTPQLFERYLPFALALGVEQAWAERFAAVFANLRGGDGGSYHPAWYNGTWNSLDLGSHTARLTSKLDSAISSSMTAPGSSSGGGGFSGGGGGGGGGGGW
ncbi:MAG TPA: DUF2207 domain-containing protein [Woeseiaceae bacterium]|nr:DUF2207 domain-containing protein [Woeseiaceae bacterium]